MNTSYNIYRINITKLNDLKESLKKTELVLQETKKSKKFTSSFYYSENVAGNEVWWWKIYIDFVSKENKKPSKTPKNIFNYGLFLSVPISKNALYFYAISLGKSHFYLQEFIDRDFGINLAVRMAKEDAVLLKKSTYFSSVKTGEVSSYQRFIENSYEPGESVDHLKSKATDLKKWGERNIVFSDSIQLVSELTPSKIEDLLINIESAMKDKEIISLPKLEMIKDLKITEELDALLIKSIRNGYNDFRVSEFELTNGSIEFMSDNFNYELFTRNGNGPHNNKVSIGSVIEKSDIEEYFKELKTGVILDNVKVSFKNDNSGTKNKNLKSILESFLLLRDQRYFLRNGVWYTFNKTFMEYLENSLNSISFIQKESLDEDAYIKWANVKSENIKNNNNHEPDEIVYREYYFNKLMAEKYSYDVWDRKNRLVKSINKEKPDYKVEMADLYKEGTVVSVKISDDISSLVYNITQSATAIELYAAQAIKEDEEINSAVLWFVFTKGIDKITDFNSIQFLLSLESWKKRIEKLGIKPILYVSKHINKPEKPKKPSKKIKKPRAVKTAK